MTPKRKIVVVDGSNLATEGRTRPSLVQLDEAVRAIADEIGDVDIIVVVDATFEHRIDESERPRFKEAELEGEIVTPPAGAIGRGDAFILKIASRAGAIVFSNDSFQEFHGEHPWLFEDGRLIGGKPIAGIGWVFTPRNPVRGPKSRASRSRATKGSPTEVVAAPAVEARKAGSRRGGAAQDASARASAPTATATKKAAARKAAVPEASKSSSTRVAAKRSTEKRSATPVQRKSAAKAAAKAEAPAAATARPSSKAPARKAKSQAAEAARSTSTAKKAAARTQAAATAASRASSRTASKPVNTSRAFQALVARHPIGSRVEGEVNSFTSHGATVTVTVGRGTQVVGYAPLAGLAKPAPTRARDVLTKGERALFRIKAFDEERRIAELSLL